jgi:hypothetical protein
MPHLLLLADEVVLRLSKDSVEVLSRQALELHADGQAALRRGSAALSHWHPQPAPWAVLPGPPAYLQLCEHVAGLAVVEGSAANKQNWRQAGRGRTDTELA